MERNLCLDWQALVQEAVARRKQQRFTQEQLAVLAGVSKPTLNTFEQGKTNMSLTKAFKILACLGLVTQAFQAKD
jgi:DNA-binding XRE family transcriptional regulator